MADERLLDIRWNDGSRHFASLPETYTVTYRDWTCLLDHIALLSGAKLAEATTDFVTEGWIDFELEGHRFTMNNPFDEWWFFVENPACDDATLERVVAHFAKLLRP